MKIGQSLASIYQTQVPAQRRSNTHGSAIVAISDNNNNQRAGQERVVAGEVLRNQQPPSDEVYNRSRVFQQTLFRESSAGSTTARQAIASYENNTGIRKEGKAGEFINLYA